MNEIRIRKEKESDLPVIKKLTTELIESIYNKEGLAPSIAIKNGRNFSNYNRSYILVAEED